MWEMPLMSDTMPSPQMVANSSPQFRAATRPKPNLTKSFSTCYANSDGDALNQRSSTTKVRLVRVDPDATDSSSDEEQQKIFPKRVLAEIIMPTQCFMLSDSDNDSDEGFFLKYARMDSIPKSRRKKRCVPASLKMGSLRALTSCRSKQVALKPWHTNVSDPLLDQDNEHIDIDDENINENSACSVRHQEKCSPNSGTVGLELLPSSEACDALSESSIASTGHKSSSLCFKVDRMISSPSSVLENMVSENCESPLGAHPDKVPEKDLPRNGSNTMDADEVYKRDVMSEARLMCSSAEESLVISATDVNSKCSSPEHANGIIAVHTVTEHDGMTINQLGWKSMLLPTLQQPLPLVSPILFEEDMSLFDIEHIFDVESLSDLQQGCMDSLDRFLDGSELNFDLDPEALAWINVPSTCGH